MPYLKFDSKLLFQELKERVRCLNLLAGKFGFVLVLSKRVFPEADLVVFQELLNLILHKRDQRVVIRDTDALRE